MLNSLEQNKVQLKLKYSRRLIYEVGNDCIFSHFSVYRMLPQMHYKNLCIISYVSYSLYNTTNTLLKANWPTRLFRFTACYFFQVSVSDAKLTDSYV